MTDWYIHKSGVILAPSKDWEPVIYLFSPEGIGDCMNRSGEWAAKKKCYKTLYTVTRWLKERKRWPDCFNNDRMAKSRIQREWSKWMYKLNIRENVLYRSQSYMTRDSYIPYYYACLVLGHHWKIAEVKPPLYLYRPTFNIWRRYLITGRGLWLYYFLTLNYPKKDFVIRLRKYMELAVELKQSR